jgi:hypothetical protein
MRHPRSFWRVRSASLNLQAVEIRVIGLEYGDLNPAAHRMTSSMVGLISLMALKAIDITIEFFPFGKLSATLPRKPR